MHVCDVWTSVDTFWLVEVICLSFMSDTCFFSASWSRLAESPAGWFIDPETLTKHATQLSRFHHTSPPPTATMGGRP